MFIKRIILLFSLLCVLGQSGFCLAFLQLAGWSRMVVELTEFVPLERAVEAILSGEEMCGICDFVVLQESLDETFVLIAERLAAPAVWQDIAQSVCVDPCLYLIASVSSNETIRAQWIVPRLEQPPRWV